MKPRRPLLLRVLLSAALGLLVPFHAAAELWKPTEMLALCYHDIVVDEQQTLIDPMSITVDSLVAHFSWLANNGYQPITVDQWLAAERGGPLPEKPVLLTFDDGYSSFKTRVLPLLELFGFPAVLAPVTNWIDTPQGQAVKYGDEYRPREDFLSWEDLRRIQATGLVEIASHSHDLHRGVLANPQGNLMPAAAAHAYLADGRRYEEDAQYSSRVRADLRLSADLIEKHLGQAPRTMVWPYGAYNDLVNEVSGQVGMPVTMSLNDSANLAGSPTIHRVLIDADTDLPMLVEISEQAFGERQRQTRPMRAAHVDLDYIYDEEPEQMRANLDLLLDRIRAMQINTVFLQAFADPDGDGVADALYFPNRHLPLRADLFSRVAWQMKTRAEVNVFAWMPVLAFTLPDADLNEALAVRAADNSHEQRYHRLSPFYSDARRIISEIYDDLGRGSSFAGVLFHDDAFLTDQEDVGARNRQPEAVGLNSADKTQYLIDFTHELSGVLRRWHPGLRTARNMYARVLHEPVSEQWFAQNYLAFLENYDYTALMAMPFMENVAEPEKWLKDTIRLVADSQQDALSKTLFHLQTIDWRTGEQVSNRTLREQFDVLLRSGGLNIAYYPDDFLRNHPDMEMVRSRLSVNAHPALKLEVTP